MENWSKEDINYLVENYQKPIKLKEIMIQLDRSRRAVLHKAARLGLSRLKAPHNKPKDPQHRVKIDKKYYEDYKKIIYLKKKERIRNYKKELVKILGGKCQKCGYNKCLAAIDFHHNKTKENSISSMFSRCSKEKILKEAGKCSLLCANCHREIHYKGP